LAVGVAATVFAPAILRAQTTTIRIGQNPNDAFGEGLYGVDNGIFQAAGLDVQATLFPNGQAQAAALVGGTIDVGLGEATELANGVVRGLPFGIFAGGALYDSTIPISALVVAPDSTIRTAKDLEGQTIAVPVLVSLSANAVRAWLVQNGADLTKVHFVELTNAAMAPAVAHGTVAAAHVGEPFLTGAGTTVRRFAQPYDAIAKQYLTSDWFASRDWLAAKAATARKLAAAIYDTARWANANHDGSAAIIAKYAKLDVDRLKGMNRFRYATALDPRMIQPVLDLGTTYGGLPRHVDAAELIVRI